jgi:hypothetical protein
MARQRISLAAIALSLLSTPVLAQNAGIGLANSGSDSTSYSGAVNQNIFQSPSDITSRTRVSGSQTVRSVPSAIAPGLTAAGIETCLGSVSGGGSFVGGGFSFGGTVKDDDCNRRLYARQLYNMGFRQAAAIIQCISPEVNYAMAAAGTPCPVPPNMASASLPSAAVVAPVALQGDTNNPPPGFAVNPEYLAWQRQQAELDGLPRDRRMRRRALADIQARSNTQQSRQDQAQVQAAAAVVSQ